ncbi:PEGA domain-containing protein [Sorangium sp. So ce1153]|uniref:PEGA domain-containing protein n=1 Tax=Sorangium sp. So ce1153 TaxID=3133333 RepID=UPI003F64461F
MNKHALLCSLGLAIALTAPASSAQTAAGSPGAAEVDALTDKARQLYDEGLAALNRSRWAEAHASFLAAWRIKQHYQIASNLGVAELRLGKHRDAAEHLSWYLREAPAERTAQRQRAEALLKEALAKVASVTVSTVPAGAEVTVDGAVVGRTPMTLPVFLEPGPHVISAELDGYKPAQEQTEPAVGDAIGITLHLVRSDAGAPAAMAAPATAAPRAASGTGPTKLRETTAAPPEARSWVPAIVLGAASVVGLGVGVGLTVAANDASAETSSQRVAIWNAGGGCIDAPAEHVGGCAKLRDGEARVDAFSNGARIAYTTSGLLLAGALTYWLWPATPSGNVSRVQLVPNLGARRAGIIAQGAW